MDEYDEPNFEGDVGLGSSNENVSDDEGHGMDESDELFRSEDDVEVGERVDQGAKYSNLLTEDVLSMQFGSELEAYTFYCDYAASIGFVVRKHEVSRDKMHNIVSRQFVCNKEGLRQKKHLEKVDRVREHRPLTRTNCLARLRVALDKSIGRWRVTAFEAEHNHELTPSRFVHLMTGRRSVPAADKVQGISLYLCGIRSCHILSLLVAQRGGLADLGFDKKDWYNYLDQQRRERIKEGDAVAALSYLQAKADTDDMLYVKYTTEDCYRLQHLIWADGRSIADYECFGDVLAFDTTYKRNRYNKPLVIFSGRNHHDKTVVFGCALVGDETFATYVWVLKSFLEAMRGVQPKTVITDGDAAMRNAIRQAL